MSKPYTALTGEKIWELPPLILHPFNERMPAAALLEHSKAALILSGVLPGDGSGQEELLRRVLFGRYSEIRMLFFLGKDVLRWVEQCVDWAARFPAIAEAEIRHQSFAGLLTARPPEDVKRKLVEWGVADYASIFTRAIGMNAMFSSPPPFECLAPEFLQNYHRYADALFRCYMESQPHRAIASSQFRFELYASGEYARLLESEWDGNSAPARIQCRGGDLLKRLLCLVVLLVAMCGTVFPQAKSGTAPKAAPKAEAPQVSLLDINSASEAELRNLPGIGDAYAAKIVQNRPYRAKNELVQKKVVPEGTYDKIKDQIVARQAAGGKKK